MSSAILSPSLLSASFSSLAELVRRLESVGVGWLHLDVMDGNFVPNITFGPDLIKAIRKECGLFFDVHLMVEEPGRYLESFASAGADLLVIHAEASRHPQRDLAHIRAMGLKSGIALNPDTSLEAIRWLANDIDLLLLMGVNPGFSGQKFIPQTIEKISSARSFLDGLGYSAVPIQVDGGVACGNASALVESGADILVSGSAFFSHADFSGVFEKFGAASRICSPRPSHTNSLGWRSRLASQLQPEV